MAIPDAPARPVLPMRWHIGLCVARHIEIEDVGHTIDVDTSSCNVGRDEDRRIVPFEIVEDPLAFVLALIAMDGFRFDVRSEKMLGDAIGTMFGL